MIDQVELPPDMAETLASFGSSAEEIVRPFYDVAESSEPPSMIYHYTDDAGLRGILESGIFRLTDVFDLNDPSELEHGFSHAVEALKAKAGTGASASRNFAEIFETFVSNGGVRTTAHNFVCSFSRCGDDLGQWRAYADNGRGFALGFDTQGLKAAFRNRPQTSLALPVTYDNKKLFDLQTRLVDLVFPLISQPQGKGPTSSQLQAYLTELSARTAANALRIAVAFKHEAYRNEQEYRFLEVHKAGPFPWTAKHRSRRYTLVRYTEFDWWQPTMGSLRRIVIGPASDRERSQKFAIDCLHEFGLGQRCSVTQSAIPHRNL